MKKIIYAGPFQMPDKNAAAHRVLNNAKILRGMGYEVIFVGLNSEAKESFENTLYEYEGFKIYEIKCAGSTEKMKKFACLNWLDFLLDEYNEIVSLIAYDYYAVGLYKLRKYCLNKKISLIADSDEWFAPTGKNIAEKLIRWADSFWRMRIIQPKLDGMITISEFLYAYYNKRLPTIQVPPLVDKSEEKWKRKSDAISDNVIRLVYSGSPGLIKDKINVVVSAVSKINVPYELKLDIIGLSCEEFITMYPDYKECLGVSKNEIVFVGRVSHKKALALLKTADFSIFWREANRVTTAGFPTKFVESISSGVPVITSNTSNLSDYLTNGKNGFFVSDNVEESIFEILNKDISELKAVKNNVDSDVFDYNNFSDEFVSLKRAIERYNL